MLKKQQQPAMNLINDIFSSFGSSKKGGVGRVKSKGEKNHQEKKIAFYLIKLNSHNI
jgi:hypothetical protein